MGKKRELKKSLLQGLLVTGYIALVFGLTTLVDNGIWVASLGASAFIAIVFPRANSSRVRFLLGGYLIGSASGILGGHISRWLTPSFAPLIACAAAVFLSVFLMAWLDFEHPPSVALAISITLSHRPWLMALAAVACMGILCLVKTAALLYADRRGGGKATDSRTNTRD